MKMGAMSPAKRETRSPEWHLANSWEQDESGIWVDSLYLRMQRAQRLGVAEARQWREDNGLPQRPKVRIF